MRKDDDAALWRRIGERMTEVYRRGFVSGAEYALKASGTGAAAEDVLAYAKTLADSSIIEAHGLEEAQP